MFWGGVEEQGRTRWRGGVEFGWKVCGSGLQWLLGRLDLLGVGAYICRH